MKKYFFLITIAALFSSSCVEGGDYQIVKVSGTSLSQSDFGKAQNHVGYQFHYIDKFYSTQRGNASPQENGETFIVEWSGKKIQDSSEEIQLVFEYSSLQQPEIKRKTINLSVDRSGLYETTIEHTADEYKSEGAIDAWRISIVKNDQVLARKQSAIWIQS